MKKDDMSEREDGLRREDGALRAEAALDAALAANLVPPQLPLHFRSRLLSSVRAAALEDQAAVRRALAGEAQRKLNELRTEYVEVRRRTLAAYVGLAFVAGVMMAIALPWILQTFGSLGMYVVPMAAGVAGIAVGLTWLRHAGWLG
jgi:hypothetical protein